MAAWQLGSPARQQGSPTTRGAKGRPANTRVAPAPAVTAEDPETWTGVISSLHKEAGAGSFPDMKVVFELPIPEALTSQLNTDRSRAGGELGRNSPLLVVEHDSFRGLARCLHCEGGGKVVMCRDARAWATGSDAHGGARDEGAEGEEYKWTLHRPAGCGYGVNAMVVPAGPGERGWYRKGSAFFLPPLVLHTRCSIFSVDHVNIECHTFRADLYVELRMRAITQMQDPVHVRELLSIIHADENRIEFRNASEYTQDKEVWVDHVPSPLVKGAFDYCFKIRAKALFNEPWDLRSFPFDVQEVNVVLTMGTSARYLTLAANEETPSLFQAEAGVQLSSIFELGLHDLVLTVPMVSEPSESSAGSVYPRCVFRTYLRRRATKYLWTMLVPMGVITMLMALSSGSEYTFDALTSGAEHVYMATADRLNVTLTLILTAVAFKIVVSHSAPRTHSLTLLDAHHLVCFLFLLVAVLENVIYAAYVDEALRLGVAAGDLIEEWVVFSAYLALFLLVNVAWGFVLLVRKLRFRTLMRDLRTLELLKRETANLRDDDVAVWCAPQAEASQDYATRLSNKTDLMRRATINAGGHVHLLWGDADAMRRLLGLRKPGQSAAPFRSHFGKGRSAEKERQRCKTLLEEVRRKQLLSELYHTTISSPTSSKAARRSTIVSSRGVAGLYQTAQASEALGPKPVSPLPYPMAATGLVQSGHLPESRTAWSPEGGDVSRCRFHGESAGSSPVRGISPNVRVMDSHVEEGEGEGGLEVQQQGQRP